MAKKTGWSTSDERFDKIEHRRIGTGPDGERVIRDRSAVINECVDVGLAALEAMEQANLDVSDPEAATRQAVLDWARDEVD